MQPISRRRMLRKGLSEVYFMALDQSKTVFSDLVLPKRANNRRYARHTDSLICLMFTSSVNLKYKRI